jgi:hypothetical protein
MGSPTKEEISKFKDIISSEIINYIEKGRTIGQVSSALKIPKTSFRRYIDKESDAIPNSETAFVMLKLTRPPAEAAVIMKEVYPRWWTSMGVELVKTNANSPHDVDNPNEINNFEFNSISASIFHMAHSDYGVSIDWIEENFGKKHGLEETEKLVDKGFLLKDGLHYKTPKAYTTWNLHTCVSLLKSHMESFPYEKVGKEVLLNIDTRSYTDKIHEAVISKFIKLKQDLDELWEQNENSSEPKHKLLTQGLYSVWDEICEENRK